MPYIVIVPSTLGPGCKITAMCLTAFDEEGIKYTQLPPGSGEAVKLRLRAVDADLIEEGNGNHPLVALMSDSHVMLMAEVEPDLDAIEIMINVINPEEALNENFEAD